MAPFDPPDMPAVESIEWMRAAKPCFANPNLLWGPYWHRFNTITIPILDTPDFFQDAMDASKIAENRQHLESILATRAQQRKVDLIEKMNAISIAAFTQRRRFSSMNTRYEASKASQYGCLNHFVHFLHGEVYGWENEQPDVDFSSLGNRQAGDANNPVVQDGDEASASSSSEEWSEGKQPDAPTGNVSPVFVQERQGETESASSSHETPHATGTAQPDNNEVKDTGTVTTATPLPATDESPPESSTPKSSIEAATIPSPAPSSVANSYMDMPLTPSPQIPCHVTRVMIPDEVAGTNIYDDFGHQTTNDGQNLSRKRARLEYNDDYVAALAQFACPLCACSGHDR